MACVKPTPGWVRFGLILRVAERRPGVYPDFMNFRLPTREEIHRAVLQGEAAIVELFAQVGQQVEGLARQLETQAAALNELQARLAKTSANSSKPPSSDGYAKPKRTTSLRKPGQKPRGGQPGHGGDTLERVATPDRAEVHPVVACGQCGASLADVAVTAQEVGSVLTFQHFACQRVGM